MKSKKSKNTGKGMRISILMSLASPWSRQIAVKLANSNNKIQIIDFDAEQSAQYLKRDDQKKEIDHLHNSVERIDLIQSSLKSKLRYLIFPSKLKGLIKSFNADVLLTLYGGGYATMGYLSRFRPYAVYIVGSDIMVMNPLKKILTRITLNKASFVFVNGKFLASKTAEISPAANIKPLYIGIDTKKFKPVKKKPGKIKLICTRGFSPVYNNQYIIEAIAKLQEDLPDFEMIFSSKGPLLEEVKKYANEVLSPKIRKKVVFYGGVTSVKLVKLLQSADIYISMSRSDGTSISMLEAMSCALYPLLSDIPQNSEWLSRDNMTLIPLDQPEFFANAIRETLLQISKKRKSAQKNRKLVIDQADENNNVKELHSILASSIS